MGIQEESFFEAIDTRLNEVGAEISQKALEQQSPDAYWMISSVCVRSAICETFPDQPIYVDDIMNTCA
eukprot:4414079-Pyramimonas_sp.AAC.1